MDKKIIKKSIEINATPDKVWRVFTDPAITREMGGEYATDWKVGSSFGWKNLIGNMYTSGIILQVETDKLLKHNLFEPEDNTQISSVITYRLKGNKGNTTLSAQEEINFDMTSAQLKEVKNGWEFALGKVKETAEKL